MEGSPVANVRAIYEQWQQGKILDSEEKQALRTKSGKEAAERSEAGGSFADLLKHAAVDTKRAHA